MNMVPNAELVDDLGKEIVTSLAPYELPVYRANRDAFFENPEKAVESSSDKEDMLAFGSVASGATFLTPVILSVVSEVVKYLVGVIKETARTEGAPLLSDTVKSYFVKLRQKVQPASQPAPEELSLSDAELRLIHKLAYEKGIQSKLNEASARALAESLVGSIVLAT